MYTQEYAQESFYFQGRFKQNIIMYTQEYAQEYEQESFYFQGRFKQNITMYTQEYAQEYAQEPNITFEEHWNYFTALFSLGWGAVEMQIRGKSENNLGGYNFTSGNPVSHISIFFLNVYF